MLPFLVRVLELADRGRSGGDDRRRQRGGEDIGTAGEADRLELRMVGNSETSNRADRFGKGSEDEIEIALSDFLIIHAA
ncbi:hypothetical protein, partial [Pseudomonas hunanensis]|uniref:hypothetical protein n=1 Tax=Pseudomonas hunanensis TaxID=1247546 RepID=UPI0030D89F70